MLWIALNNNVPHGIVPYFWLLSYMAYRAR